VWLPEIDRFEAEAREAAFAVRPALIARGYVLRGGIFVRMASPASPARTQLERTRATTGQLIDAARELFAADGYAATSLDAVVEKAGVTKGALYHHFASKRELFAAVYDREQRALADLIDLSSKSRRDPLERFHAGCHAFFEGSLDPGTQRITLIDAPGALGWERMREIEAKYSTAQLREALKAVIAAGRIEVRPIEPLTHLLLGALCEAAMMVARSKNPRQEARRSLRELRALVDGISI
jgi:AcrR family transcriptional regulator